MNPVTYYTALGAKVTSPFGPRTPPKDGATSYHNGVDFGGKPAGYVWTSPYPGVVTYIGERGSRGRVVAMRIDGEKIIQVTQHHDAYKCKVGDQIKAGDPIGTNGSTGNVTGPHLHYELRVDDGSTLGAPVWGDPAKYIYGGGGMEHTVKAGETLGTIATKYGISSWRLLADWNRDRYPDIGTGTNALVRVGWVLRVSAPKAPEPAPEPEVTKADLDALAVRVKALENLWAKIKAL